MCWFEAMLLQHFLSWCCFHGFSLRLVFNKRPREKVHNLVFQFFCTHDLLNRFLCLLIASRCNVILGSDNLDENFFSSKWKFLRSRSRLSSSFDVRWRMVEISLDSISASLLCVGCCTFKPPSPFQESMWLSFGCVSTGDKESYATLGTPKNT